MKDVKIVFTDLDRTLTYEPGKIDIKNKAVFEKLKDIGIPVVLSTGRSILYTMPISKQYSMSNYIITSNGAEVYNYLAKKLIYRSEISKENIDILNKLIEKYNLFFKANGVERNYTNRKDKKGYVIKNNITDIFEEGLAQVTIQSYNINNMKLFRRDLQRETNLKIIHKTNHIEEGKLLYYDVVNEEVNKGLAITKLCEHLNIDLKRVMAIGDDENDEAMFKCVGYKVAVANALDKLKEQADYVTLSNKENGVLVILNKLYSELTN